MDLYPSLVLLHILATGGLFAGLGIEVAALRRVQRATTATEARSWLPSLQHPGGMLMHLSMLTLVATGLGLAALGEGLRAWMTAALVAIALMITLAVSLGSKPLRALAGSLAEEQPGTGWTVAARDRGLHWSTWLRVGLYGGVLGLMSLRPGTAGAAWTLVIGLVLGATAAAGTRPRDPSPVGVTTTPPVRQPRRPRTASRR